MFFVNVYLIFDKYLFYFFFILRVFDLIVLNQCLSLLIYQYCEKKKFLNVICFERVLENDQEIN